MNRATRGRSGDDHVGIAVAWSVCRIGCAPGRPRHRSGSSMRHSRPTSLQFFAAASRRGFVLVALGFVIAAGLAFAAAEPPTGQAVPLIPGGGRFKRLNADDGLPTNDIRSIAQDHSGFIWLGTANAGVCRYDGYEVHRYMHDPEDPSSLSHNFVWSLLVDRNGTVWLGTAGGGLNRYDPRTDTFVHYQHQPGDPRSLPHNSVLSLMEDSAGALWVGTRAGLSRFDPEQGEFTTYARPPDPGIGPNLNSVRSITEDLESGCLWLGTSDSLCVFNPQTGAFTTILRPLRDLVPTGYNSVNTVLKDEHDWFWIGTERGLLRFRPDMAAVRAAEGGTIYGEFEVFTHDPDDPDSIPAEYIRDGLIDRRGRLWLATQRGLGLFLREDPRCIAFQNSPGDPESIGSNHCLRVFEDAAGNIWVTSQHNGVSRLNAWGKDFRNFRNILGDADTLANDTVTSLDVGADGVVWAGTVDGLSRFDGRAWMTYRNDPDNPATLGSNDVATIARDAGGHLWVGTAIAGLSRMEHDGRFTHFLRRPGDPEPAHLARLPYSHNQISSLLPGRDGGLWVGARSWGLDHFAGDAFLHRATNDAEMNRLPVDYAVFGYETPEGRLFYGTEQAGLVELDPATEMYTKHLPDPANPESPLNKYITTVFPDGAGSLWVGSINGLFRFSLEERRFIGRLTRTDGLPADSVASVIADRGGTLWVGTSAGLAAVDPDTGVRRVFDRADGLPSNQITARAAAIGPDGRVYFGTTAGVTSFFPDRLVTNTIPPPVVITGLEVSGRQANTAGLHGRPDAVRAGRAVQVGPDRRDVTFRFAAMDFTAPARNRYAYRLVPYQDEWQPTDASRRLATYTNLAAGRYVFEVKGSNNDGVWNEEPARLVIEVRRHWWSTAWFRGALVAGAALAAIGGYALRMRAVARRSEQLERQVAERTRELEVAKDQAEAASRAKSVFLATMSHELRTPLNSVLGYAQRLQLDPGLSERHASSLATIRQSGEHLLTLINDVLDLSRAAAGRMSLSPEDFQLQPFLRGIVDVMRVRVEEKGLRFEVHFDRELPQVLRADQTRLRQVLFNLLSNAARFTDEGVVKFRVRVRPGSAPGHARLLFEVEDTGIGLAPEQVARLFQPFEQACDERHRGGGAGLGLVISRQLVELMGGRIDVASAPGRGSRFSFEVEFPANGGLAESEAAHGRIVGYEGARRVLHLIDRDAARRAALADALLALDFRVVESGDVTALSERTGEADADVVLANASLVMANAERIEVAGEPPREVPLIRLDGPDAHGSSGLETADRSDAVRSSDVSAVLSALARVLGLTWVRRAADSVAREGSARAGVVFSTPPAGEVEALWALAVRGDMRGVRERARHLANLGPEHRALAEHLQALAADYKSRAILATMRQFGRLSDKP